MPADSVSPPPLTIPPARDHPRAHPQAEHDVKRRIADGTLESSSSPNIPQVVRQHGYVAAALGDVAPGTPPRCPTGAHRWGSNSS